MIAQAAGMIGRWDKTTAQGIHLGKGSNFSGVAEIVGVFATGEGRAGGRLNSDNAWIGFSEDLIPHEWRNQPPEVGPAAGTSDNDIRILVDHFHGLVAFQPNDRLMQENLV